MLLTIAFFGVEKEPDIKHYLTILTFLFLGHLTLLAGDKDSLVMDEIQDFLLTRISVDSLWKQAHDYYNDEKYKHSLSLYEAIENRLKEKPRGIKKDAEIYYDLGYNYFFTNQYPKTIESLNEYLLQSPDTKPKKKAKIFIKMAQSSRYLGDLEQAYSYQLQSLNISESIHDVSGVTRANYEIGSILFFQENYKRALDSYQKAYELNVTEKDSFSLYSCLAAIGSTYNRMDMLDSAILYNNKSLQIAHSLEYKTGVAYAYHNLASDFLMMDSFKNAIKFAELSMELKNEIKDLWGISGTHRTLGQIYVEQQSYDKAQYHLEEAFKIAEKINSKPRLVEIYELCAELHLLKGNHKKANDYLKKYINTKDQIINETSLMKMESSRVHYEVSKKDRQIKLLQKDQEVQQFKYKATLYIVGLMLLFTLILGYSYSKLKTTISLLAQKNKIIEEQNVALEHSNKELEQFAYVASHDMREPIRTIRSFNGLLGRKYGEVLGEKGSEFIHFIDDASKRMDALLTELLEYSRVHSRNKTKEIIDLSDPVILAADNLRTALEEENVVLNTKDLPEVSANKIQMTRLFQNLISNGIKYNKNEEKTINIDYKQNGTKYIFSIQDNGIGIEQKYHEKIFEIFRRLHNNTEYEGSGIGLATCKKIVEQHNGKIWVESEIGKGTKILFTLPIPI